MTIQTQYWVHEPDQPLAEHVGELATPEQVREFVMLLASDLVSDALHRWDIPYSRPGESKRTWLRRLAR